MDHNINHILFRKWYQLMEMKINQCLVVNSKSLLKTIYIWV